MSVAKRRNGLLDTRLWRPAVGVPSKPTDYCVLELDLVGHVGAKLIGHFGHQSGKDGLADTAHVFSGGGDGYDCTLGCSRGGVGDRNHARDDVVKNGPTHVMAG